jgi:hypothetical protein
MGFLTKEQIGYIIDGSVFDCDAHNFQCDRADNKSIEEHFAKFDHTDTGGVTCAKCQKVEVKFKNNRTPPPGKNPIVFCDKCKKELVAEIKESESGQPTTASTFENLDIDKGELPK